MRSSRVMVLLSVLLLGGALGAVRAEPLYGPRTFERTSDPPDVYQDAFSSPVPATFVLYVQNGDGDESRVAGGSIRLNGTLVVRASDLNEQAPGLRRPVEVRTGTNLLEVKLEGAPGSFVTVAIVRDGEVYVLSHGRLLLTWGRNEGDNALTLFFKNGSHRAARRLRVVFYDPEGNVVAKSDRIVLEPGGSMEAAVQDLMSSGSWTEGSIEVFYAGRGSARLFGAARQASLGGGTDELVPLEHAGHAVFRTGPAAASRAVR